MGVEYQARIIVGLPMQEIDIDEDDVYENLDIASAYFDADSESIIAGVLVYSTDDYQSKELDFDPAKVDSAKERFTQLTGKQGKLYLSPHGW